MTDITYLPTDEGWIYMAAVMDLWNREIVSYRISRHISLGLVEDVISQLKPCRGALIHSDMGWTYTNPSYIKHLKNLGFRQSMSRKGNCWDNACIVIIKLIQIFGKSSLCPLFLTCAQSQISKTKYHKSVK